MDLSSNQPTPITPTPPASSPPPKSKLFLGLIIGLILGLGLSVGGYLTYNQFSPKNSPPTSPPSPMPTTITPTPKPTSNNASPKLPVIVYASPLSGDSYTTQKTEIQTKIIDPFVLYHASRPDGYTLVSVLVEINSSDTNNQFPYKFTAINEGGIISSELISQSGTTLNWWTPTCMGPCNYSPEFQSTYPDIVSQTNP